MLESYEDNNNNNDYYPIIMAKDSILQLPLSLTSSSSINIAKWKDERLEHIEIPKGLIETLQNSGFTV